MKFLEDYKTELVQTIGVIDNTKVQTAIDWFKEAREAGKHIFVCGNGGSASTASHFA